MTKPDFFEGLPVPERPHVVIIGAGASMAALPNGDANGKKLPSMIELLDLLNIKEILKDHSVETQEMGFEEIFSDLYERGDNNEVLSEIEEKVFNYFNDLQLPEEPTIYDYLVLGLRSKDLIGSFNWDPLLMQALERNYGVVTLPHAAFLHGNTRLGHCALDERKGPFPGTCNICNQPYQRSRLLYPVKEKNYREDPFIRGEWDGLTLNLVNAMLLTIFGYGVPKTDVEARHEIEFAWNLRGARAREEIEILNIDKPEKLINEWESLFVRQHFRILSDFSQTFVSNFPRRSCEAYFSQFYLLEPHSPCPAPQNVTLSELQDWFHQFGE